jgi:hypothetical protein
VALRRHQLARLEAVVDVPVEDGADLRCRVKPDVDLGVAQELAARAPLLDRHQPLSEVIGELDHVRPAVRVELLQPLEHARAVEVHVVVVGAIRTMRRDLREFDPHALRPRQGAVALELPVPVLEVGSSQDQDVGDLRQRRGEARHRDADSAPAQRVELA